MQLSPQERALLVESLLATLGPGKEVESKNLWLQEAERRYEKYRAGDTLSRPAKEVVEDADQRLK